MPEREKAIIFVGRENVGGQFCEYYTLIFRGGRFSYSPKRANNSFESPEGAARRFAGILAGHQVGELELSVNNGLKLDSKDKEVSIGELDNGVVKYFFERLYEMFAQKSQKEPGVVSASAIRTD